MSLFTHPPVVPNLYDLMCFQVEWKPEPEPNKHCSQMLVKHALTVFGRHWPLLDLDVLARQVMTGSSARGCLWAVQSLQTERNAWRLTVISRMENKSWMILHTTACLDLGVLRGCSLYFKQLVECIQSMLLCKLNVCVCERERERERERDAVVCWMP